MNNFGVDGLGSSSALIAAEITLQPKRRQTQLRQKIDVGTQT